MIVYILWTVLIFPLQGSAVALHLGVRRTLPLIYHRVCLWIFDLKVVVVGTQVTDRPALFVSNHVSYLDIEVLGALIAGSFVAKSEVARWPVFGVLSKLQETVFVDRQARRQIKHQRATMTGRLTAGDNLILFPEGTSSDGNRVLPFKTALFSVATHRTDGRPLTVQPVSVTPVMLDGIPLGRLLRPLYAWYGDMSLGPHLWQVAKLGGITIVVEFHAPMTVETTGSRKALAEMAHRAVCQGMARALAGPLPEPATHRPLHEPQPAT